MQIWGSGHVHKMGRNNPELYVLNMASTVNCLSINVPVGNQVIVFVYLGLQTYTVQWLMCAQTDPLHCNCKIFPTSAK